MNLGRQTPSPWMSQVLPEAAQATGHWSPNTTGGAFPTSRRPCGHMLQDRRHKALELSRCSLV